MQRILDAHGLRRVAAEAICDEKTVARYLDGLRVRSTSRTRIEAALMRLGLVGMRSAERHDSEGPREGNKH